LALEVCEVHGGTADVCRMHHRLEDQLITTQSATSILHPCRRPPPYQKCQP
jgi:hypothetical protein